MDSPLSLSAINWLQSLFRVRIGSDASLTFNNSDSLWILSFPGCPTFISFPKYDSLYKLGDSSHLSCQSIDISTYLNFDFEEAIPAPGFCEFCKPLISVNTKSIDINYDLPGLIYWCLSRCEEVNPSESTLDIHNRFKYSESHAFHHGYYERPVVDEWLCILRQLIKVYIPRYRLTSEKFKIIVSHDVDIPSAYCMKPKRMFARMVAAEFAKKRSFSKVASMLWIRQSSRLSLHPQDPFNTFQWLIDLSDKAGIRSAFYFISGHTDKKKDGSYDITHPAIRQLLRTISQNGHEIGLHPSYNTFNDPSEIKKEIQHLKGICGEEGIVQPKWGSRMHFLRWEWPSTAIGLQNAGIDYDTTLVYADRPGFRCGTCHPYIMFDPLSQKCLKLTQIPLIVMECSLLSNNYMNLGHGDATRALLKVLLKRCEKVNGQFTLLWHNSNLATQEDKELYKDIVLKQL